MSGLSFRARSLDPVRAIPILRSSEVPNIDDESQIKRVLPQMATGMEKEEEEEHHLKVIMDSQSIYSNSGVEQSVIPTPAADIKVEYYPNIYANDFELPKHYIRIQDRFLFEDSLIDYDADSEDEVWVTSLNKKSKLENLSLDLFETLIDNLERACSYHMIVPFQDVRDHLKVDDATAKRVYEYWRGKREKNRLAPLRPSVKIDRTNDPINATNPYVAFRRRTEKIQTRKNRKQDENVFERMVKLRRDLDKARTLLELVKKREKMKRETLHLALELFEARLSSNDWTVREIVHHEDETELVEQHASSGDESTKKNRKLKATSAKLKRSKSKIGTEQPNRKKRKSQHYTQPHGDTEGSGSDLESDIFVGSDEDFLANRSPSVGLYEINNENSHHTNNNSSKYDRTSSASKQLSQRQNKNNSNNNSNYNHTNSSSGGGSMSLRQSNRDSKDQKGSGHYLNNNELPVIDDILSNDDTTITFLKAPGSSSSSSFSTTSSSVKAGLTTSPSSSTGTVSGTMTTTGTNGAIVNITKVYTKPITQGDNPFPFRKKKYIPYCIGHGLGKPPLESTVSPNFAFLTIPGLPDGVRCGRRRMGRGGRILIDRTPKRIAAMHPVTPPPSPSSVASPGTSSLSTPSSLASSSSSTHTSTISGPSATTTNAGKGHLKPPLKSSSSSSTKPATTTITAALSASSSSSASSSIAASSSPSHKPKAKAISKTIQKSHSSSSFHHNKSHKSTANTTASVLSSLSNKSSTNHKGSMGSVSTASNNSAKNGGAHQHRPGVPSKGLSKTNVAGTAKGSSHSSIKNSSALVAGKSPAQSLPNRLHSPSSSVTTAATKIKTTSSSLSNSLNSKVISPISSLGKKQTNATAKTPTPSLSSSAISSSPVERAKLAAAAALAKKTKTAHPSLVQQSVKNNNKTHLTTLPLSASSPLSKTSTQQQKVLGSSTTTAATKPMKQAAGSHQAKPSTTTTTMKQSAGATSLAKPTSVTMATTSAKLMSVPTNKTPSATTLKKPQTTTSATLSPAVATASPLPLSSSSATPRITNKSPSIPLTTTMASNKSKGAVNPLSTSVHKPTGLNSYAKSATTTAKTTTATKTTSSSKPLGTLTTSTAASAMKTNPAVKVSSIAPPSKTKPASTSAAATITTSAATTTGIKKQSVPSNVTPKATTTIPGTKNTNLASSKPGPLINNTITKPATPVSSVTATVPKPNASPLISNNSNSVKSNTSAIKEVDQKMNSNSATPATSTTVKSKIVNTAGSSPGNNDKIVSGIKKPVNSTLNKE